MDMNPLIEKFCTTWKTGNPELAVLYAVEHYFPDLSTAEPPIDLVKLAARRRVSEIVESEIQCDGLISRNNMGEYTIQINRSHSETRQRFTIAHEIGHTFFFDMEDQVRSRISVSDQGLESVTDNQLEERLCNVAAAEILMPRKQFLARLGKGAPTASLILSLAKVFGASIAATARRAVELCPYKLLVVRWQYEEALDAYRSVWIARGSGSATSLAKSFLVAKDQPIFGAFRSSEGFRGREWVSLGGPLGRYFVDGVSIEGKARHLLTVFILERLAERLIETGNFVADRSVSEQTRLY